MKALTWAFEQEVFPSSRKFVLVALANFASEAGACFPSISTIAELTCQKEQTVRDAIELLVQGGLLTDTGKRTGATGQIKVYRLPAAACERPPIQGALENSKDSPKDAVKTPPKTPHIGREIKEPEPEPSGEGDLPPITDYWNSKDGLRKAKNLSPRRKRALKSRMKDLFFRENWKAAIDRMAASNFCKGDNDRQWKADLDFFLQPDTVTKVMEGKYDNNRTKPTQVIKPQVQNFRILADGTKVYASSTI